MKATYSCAVCSSRAGSSAAMPTATGTPSTNETMALLRLWCHQPGVTSGRQAMASRSAANGVTDHNGRVVPRLPSFIETTLGRQEPLDVGRRPCGQQPLLRLRPF